MIDRNSFPKFFFSRVISAAFSSLDVAVICNVQRCNSCRRGILHFMDELIARNLRVRCRRRPLTGMDAH